MDESKNINKVDSDLLEYMNDLCAIGIRFTGTPNDAKAADWISKVFKKNELIVKKQQYQFMGWENLSPAELEVFLPDKTAVKLECLPYVYSSSTPKEGVSGQLKFVGKRQLYKMQMYRIFERDDFRWNKYAVVDKANHPLAYIISRDYPEQGLLAAWGVQSLPFTSPMVMVDWQAARFLESLPHDDVSATLKVHTNYNPFTTSFNVIAEDPPEGEAKPRDTILICAHYDTLYNTVGAVDNATGVASLLTLAKRRHHFKIRHHLRFAAFSGEEIGFLGSREYVKYLKERGELSRIATVLNLDMLGCNQPNWVHLSDNDVIAKTVSQSAKRLDLAKKYGGFELVVPPWPSGDQDPFFDEGIPSISLTWKGSLYRYTHHPGDTMDKVNWEVLTDSHQLAEQIIIHLSENL